MFPDGYKTYIAAGVVAVCGLGIIFNVLTWEQVDKILVLAGALGLVGIGHKLEKLRNGK